MATVPSLGRRSPQSLRDIGADAVMAVAERAARLGFGSAAVFHGSASTSDFSFVDGGAEIWLASDVDVILRAPVSCSELNDLQTQLDHLFRDALGCYGSVATRV